MASLAPEGPPAAPPQPQGGGQAGGSVELLREAIELLKSYIDDENDPEYETEVAKFIAGLLGVIAKQQGMEDKAMGISEPQKFMRRQSGAGAY